MLNNRRALKALNILLNTLGVLLYIASLFFLGTGLGRRGLSFVNAMGALVLWYLGLYGALILHEMGHALFGRLTGYRAVAMGIGGWNMLFSGGKIRMEKKTQVKGFAAQYIGVKKDEADGRAILMFSGGLIVHAGLTALYALLGVLTGRWAWFLPQILLNLSLLCLNLNPNGMTDGAKIAELAAFPGHAPCLFLGLRHGACAFTDPENGDLADYAADVPLERGGIIQAMYLNQTTMDIIEGRTRQAAERLERLIDFTENSFIRAAASCDLLLSCLLLGERDRARELVETRDVKAFLKQKQPAMAVIKAYYQIDVQNDPKAAKKSLAMAEKAMSVSPTLRDERAFLMGLMRELKERAGC